MINNELTINLKNGECKIFLQGGFYQNKTVCDYIHVHNYTEIHFAINGEIVFSIGDRKIAVNEGTVLVIPKGMYHGLVSKTEGALHTAFQIDRVADLPEGYKIDEGVTRYLFSEIEKTEPYGDHSSVVALIALICTKIFPNSPIVPHDVTDTGYLISDFFSRRYREDVRLCDLAELLHLSERQTERLVEEQTGRSFRDELTVTRMRMAYQLLSTTNMPPTRVAQYVGYRTYAGFWKAYSKYTSEK